MCPGLIQPLKMSIRIPLGVKMAGAFGWQPTDVTESGSLNFPEPAGSHRPVMGLLYLYCKWLFSGYINTFYWLEFHTPKISILDAHKSQWQYGGASFITSSSLTSNGQWQTYGKNQLSSVPNLCLYIHEISAHSSIIVHQRNIYCMLNFARLSKSQDKILKYYDNTV
jgi:hypothetical protein